MSKKAKTSEKGQTEVTFFFILPILLINRYSVLVFVVVNDTFLRNILGKV